MANIETSIVIGKPVEQVFAYLADVQNQKGASPMITEIVMDGPAAVGTRYTVKMNVMGRAMEIVNEIVGLEPNRLFAVKTLAAAPASPVTNTYTLTPEGGGTRLALSMEAVVFPGTEAMVVPQLRAGLDTSLAGIKKGLEG